MNRLTTSGTIDTNYSIPSNQTPVVDRTAQTTGYEYDFQNESGIISSAKIRNLSFSKMLGGTAVLGGKDNGNGFLQIRDGNGSAIVTADNTGITVNNGKINILDSNGTAIIDSNGLVSSNNFLIQSASNVPDETTSSTSFVDVNMGTAGTIQLIASRDVVAYFYLTGYMSNRSLFDGDVALYDQVTLNLQAYWSTGTADILSITTPGIAIFDGTNGIIQDFYGYNGQIFGVGAGTYNFKAQYRAEAGGTAHLYSAGIGFMVLGS